MRKFLYTLLALALFASPAFAQVTPQAGPYSTVGGVATLSAASTTGNTALPATVIPFGAITVYNTGSVNAFVAMGVDNTVTATTSSIPVPAGVAVTFYAGAASTYIAYITASSTATLFLWQANGPIAFVK